MIYLKLFEEAILEEIEFNPAVDLDVTFPEADIPEHEKDTCYISFNKKNKKIKHPFLSLPAGYTCPFAVDCKTKAIPDPDKPGRWKVKDFGEFRCYAARAEAQYPATRAQHWSNYNLLRAQKTTDKYVSLILKSIVHAFTDSKKGFKLKLFRIHESGDFFNQPYFDAWVEVAKALPNTTFYAYTKSLK